MKILRCTITFLILAIHLFAKRPTYCTSFSEISRRQFDSCSRVKYLLSNPGIKKHAGKLVLPIFNRKPVTFANHREFETYEYVGDITGTKFSLVKCIGPNDELVYLINRLTGRIDTLIGQPVFLNNLTDFICINNPGTDEKQQIQVCESKNGRINVRAYIKSKSDDTFFEDIAFVNRNLMFVKDNYGKCWKLAFKPDMLPKKQNPQ